MSTKAPTIAFFGATGGTVNAALVHALRAGECVVVLVRTPSKLRTQLEAQGLSSATLAAQLTIITGSSLDKAAVKQTITANRPSYLIPNIVTGLGAAPVLTFNIWRPWAFLKIDNPTLCGDSAEILLATLQDLYHENPSLLQQKPNLTFVSTTGISKGPEDVQYGMRTLYYYMLAEPHKDKKKMEASYRGAMEKSQSTGALLGSVTGVRPTLLTGDVDAEKGLGLSKIRFGTEDKPALGWSVSRADVGEWIWTNRLADDEMRKTWDGEMISLTN